MAQEAKTKTRVEDKAKRTRDHEMIRRWAEARGGRPAMVEGTQILRIDFPEPEPDAKLKPVSWEDFFRVFDDRGLELLYQEHTHDGKPSRFNKLVRPGSDTESN